MGLRRASHTHARPSGATAHGRTGRRTKSRRFREPKWAPDSKCPSGSELRSVLASLSRVVLRHLT